MHFSQPTVLAVAASLSLALILTPVVRYFARRFGFVAVPKTDRWHKKPTAMLGGIAIWLSVVIISLPFLLRITYGKEIFLATSFLFLVGLIDDLIHVKPYQKLIGQILGAAYVVYYGLSLPWTGSKIINMAFAIFWLIGITNAINLLDNMDGLASGIAIIAAGFLALSFVNGGQFTEALIMLIFAGGLLGFLVYNSNPASIFMGDCGSMFVGFFLASSAMINLTGGRSRSLLPVLAVPILVLFIPIFDTTLVTVLRKLSGRAASSGGRDHSSHRLVAIGLSERAAVIVLWMLAAVGGGMALVINHVGQRWAALISAVFVVGMIIIAVYLARIRVYEGEDAKVLREGTVTPLVIDFMYKRRVAEVLLDFLLIAVAYSAAYRFRFENEDFLANFGSFRNSLPVVLSVQMIVFFAVGVYRGVWRYFGLN